MRETLTQIEYIGPCLDTLPIDDFEKSEVFDDYKYFFELRTLEDKKSHLSISVLFDDNLSLNTEANVRTPDSIYMGKNNEVYDSIRVKTNLENWKKIRPDNWTKCNLVMVSNRSISDTVYIDLHDGEVTIIQEAKDEHGKWLPIEYCEYKWCGNSYSQGALLPEQILVLKGLKYFGDFETSLRYKLRSQGLVYYSQEFKGSIHLSQFSLPKGEVEELKMRGFTKEEISKIIFLDV